LCGVANAEITCDSSECDRAYITTNGRGISVGDAEQQPTEGGYEGDRPGDGDYVSGNDDAPGDESDEGGADPAPRPGGDTSDDGADGSAGRFPRVGPTALSTTRSTAPQVTTPPPRGIPDRPRTRGHTPPAAGPWPG